MGKVQARGTFLITSFRVLRRVFLPRTFSRAPRTFFQWSTMLRSDRLVKFVGEESTVDDYLFFEKSWDG